MKTLITILLIILIPFQGFTQGGNSKVDISNINITLLNKLLNKKIHNHNKIVSFGDVSGISVTDTVALSVGEARVTKMMKTKVSHTLPNAYDEMKGDSKTTEVGENVMYSSELMGKTFTYNDLTKKIFKGFMGSYDHKILIEASYNEKSTDVFISTFVKFKKNGSFYVSMVFSM